uniref:PAS domain-containing protein n=1 Tax=Vibrio cholerae TaxID=666 RepID=UPI0020162F07
TIELTETVLLSKAAEVCSILTILRELGFKIALDDFGQVELAERTALLRSFIDASPDLIYYRNAKGEFSGCNRAMEELTGKRESELVG